MEIELLFEELLIIICASLFVTLIFHKFKVPEIIAYIFAGALIGQHGIGILDYDHNISFIAEFGVAFLLFSIGLGFSLKQMLKMKFAVFGIGAIQVVSCTIVYALAVYLWGASLQGSILIAGALALSSTAIVTKELITKKELHTKHSKLSIGVLLFQDLVAVIFLTLVPVFAMSQEILNNDNVSFNFYGYFFKIFSKVILGIIIIMAVGRWILPFIYKEVKKTKSDEVFILATLVIILLASWFTLQLKLSMTLGSFIIGMMLGDSQFRNEIESNLRPFKDVLLGVFFVTLGMKIDISILVLYFPRLLLFTFVLIGLKILIVLIVMLLALKESKKVSLQTSIILAQAGEFGLALLTLANTEGLIPDDQASFIIILALLSMLFSVILIRNNDIVSNWILQKFNFINKKE